MKKTLFLIAIHAMLLGFIPIPGSGSSVQAQGEVSFQVFYDQLSPYGSWVEYPDYGYAWVPDAGAGFRPYASRGHWVYSEDGWTWVSDYDWGWAPFHYGNWLHDDAYGWMWLPGYEWAPAWVTWGEYGGNYCWAPIGPRVDIGVSFGTYRPAASYWNFCPREHITSVNVSNYYVTNIRKTVVVNNITVINNINRRPGGAYLRGPVPANVERFTRHPVRPVAIQAAARPGRASVQSGHLAIYRPAVQRNANNAARPATVRDLHALSPGNRGPRQGSAASRPGNPNTPAGRPAPAPHPAASRPAGQPRPSQPHPSQPAPSRAETHPRANPSQPVNRTNPQPALPASRPHNNPNPSRPASPPRTNPSNSRPVPPSHPVTQPSRPAPQAHPVPHAQPDAGRPANRPTPHPQTGVPRPMNHPAPQRQAPQSAPHPQPAPRPQEAPHPPQAPHP